MKKRLYALIFVSLLVGCNSNARTAKPMTPSAQLMNDIRNLQQQLDTLCSKYGADADLHVLTRNFEGNRGAGWRFSFTRIGSHFDTDEETVLIDLKMTFFADKSIVVDCFDGYLREEASVLVNEFLRKHRVAVGKKGGRKGVRLLIAKVLKKKRGQATYHLDLQTRISRGQPYGESKWKSRTAKRRGLESSLRPRGGPRKIKVA